MKTIATFALWWISFAAQAGPVDAFRPLTDLWPAPTEKRLATGAPGPKYWQQQADYEMALRLDAERKVLHGEQTLTYWNRSPHALPHLWLMVEQNAFAPGSEARAVESAPDLPSLDLDGLRALIAEDRFEGGATIERLVDAQGKALAWTEIGTLIRVDLPAPLESGGHAKLSMSWRFPINDGLRVPARCGYEELASGETIFELAQFYPRMAAYTDDGGWQIDQFLGRAEFALEFGDFHLKIDVPDNHVVACTGEWVNAKSTLTAIQLERLEKARSADKPVYVVTPQEAEANAKKRSDSRKTWEFRAKSVRDVAIAASAGYAWDALGVPLKTNTPLAMSFFPKVAAPLWERVSTEAIAHTLRVFSHFTFDYPYPVAISANGPVGGMEYPMISFNAPRAYEDGTYWKTPPPGISDWRHAKVPLISVVIHEVGHNFFPMLINSNERRYAFLDEGFNTFLQFAAEQSWSEKYPSRRGEPRSIVEYMKQGGEAPIVSSPEAFDDFHHSAYGKTSAALTVLRETVLGRERFDAAFREYARRWIFKRPEPADFFRTIEDVSGADLDWFWRGWFYETQPVDLMISSVQCWRIDDGDPDARKKREVAERDKAPESQTRLRDAGGKRLIEERPHLKDFYDTTFKEDEASAEDRKSYKERLSKLQAWEKEILSTQERFYVVEFENKGGLVSPVVLEIEYRDGTKETLRLPAEVWRRDTKKFRKLIMEKREISGLRLDPRWETSDIDTANNVFRGEIAERWFSPEKKPIPDNPMRKARQK